MIDIIKDTLLDTVKLVPFLFGAFLVIEFIEHKLSKESEKLITKTGNWTPFLGSLLGLVPQCGFSVIATNFYTTRIISLGTLIAIYLSTSDEMLPILISNRVSLNIILTILLTKFIVGLVFGYIIDLFRRKKKVGQSSISYDICHDEYCGCDKNHSLFKCSLIHTIKTSIFLFLITFVINVIVNYLGTPYLSKIFLKGSFMGPFMTGLMGLIPTCGASILITELYLNGAIDFAALISGLLTGSGVAILVLFRTNKNFKENFKILGMVYGISVFVGILLELVISIF